MVGRIVGQLKRHGRLREPPRSGVDRRALCARPYAIRKPKQYAVSRPGDLVQVDTFDARPLPGIIFKQFTARDVVSRWDVIQAHTRATASTAAQFLETLLHRMPFPIRALQVDGGSEFAADFEQACQQCGLRLFVLPPRSPKLNGAVERAQRTHNRGVLSGHGLLAGDEETQPRAATVGADLQHGAATSVARLLNPAAVPAAGFISEKGMKSVTNLLGMTLLGTFT